MIKVERAFAIFCTSAIQPIAAQDAAALQLNFYSQAPGTSGTRWPRFGV